MLIQFNLFHGEVSCARTLTQRVSANICICSARKIVVRWSGRQWEFLSCAASGSVGE